MDDQLARRAYYAVARAFHASNNLNFDTDQLLVDLQTALNLDDNTAMNLANQAEQDPEVVMLKQYDKSITKANMQQQAQPNMGGGGGYGGGIPGAGGSSVMSAHAGMPVQGMGRAPSMGRSMQQASQQQHPYQSQQQQDSPFSYPQQPAAKKQKKGGSLNPPVSRGGGGGGSKAGGGPAPLSVPGTGKQKSRSVPSTPQGGGATPAGGGAPGSAGAVARSGKGAAWRPLGVSAASFARVMQKGAPDEMEAYLGELNSREREIFTELIAQGVDENSPELNELHRELLRWYKLDQKQQALAQQLSAVAS